MRENSEVVIIHPDNWKILMDNIIMKVTMKCIHFIMKCIPKFDDLPL